MKAIVRLNLIFLMFLVVLPVAQVWATGVYVAPPVVIDRVFSRADMRFVADTLRAALNGVGLKTVLTDSASLSITPVFSSDTLSTGEKRPQISIKVRYLSVDTTFVFSYSEFSDPISKFKRDVVRIVRDYILPVVGKMIDPVEKK